MNELDIIGLKLDTVSVSADLIKLIRLYTSESMSVIKQHIINGDYIFYCEYESHKGVKQVISMYNELVSMGITPLIFEEGDPSDIEFLKNLSASYDEEEDDLFNDDI